MSRRKKILVIRNDKIGDFMLAWPSFALLKRQYPDAKITALVPPYTAQLARQCQWIDEVLIDQKLPFGIKDVLMLTSNIKKGGYDASISFFSETRTSLSLWLSGVSIRIGPATKIAQIFLNRKLLQKRSKSLKPEYEYNLDLVKYYIQLNNDVPKLALGPPYLSFSEATMSSYRKMLQQDYKIPKGSRIIIIHPGTGGSAINLSLRQYAALARSVASEGNVFYFITAGPDEAVCARNLSVMLKDVKHFVYHSQDGIVEFCKLISASDVFIGGSTGPLHIAGALNRCTVAFYPKKRSATSLRWQTMNEKRKRLAFSVDDYHDEEYFINVESDIVAEKIVRNLFQEASD